MKNIITFLKKIINKKRYEKEYRNADLYELLGKDYERIMYLSFGKTWDYINLRNSYDLLNENLGTQFTNEPLEKVLYKIKILYRELGDSNRPYFITGKEYRELNMNIDD